MARIINIVTQMEAGGAQGASIRMAKAMRERGIDSETWFIYKKFDTYIDEPNVVVIHGAAPTNPFHALLVVYKIWKRLRKNKPDGVITYTHYANILGQLASRAAGIKNRVATLRNPTWSDPRIARVMDRLVGSLNVYSKIIAVSSTVVESCKAYPENYKKHLQLVYNGVPPRISKMDKEAARRKFDFKLKNEVLLVNVGRLHYQKNQELIIGAMPLLKNYHLAIAGDGELRDKLTKLAVDLKVDDRVHFLGEIKPVDVPDFLRAGDIFLFPSLFEAFGFVIFEAAYNDLPIVASNIPSNVEVLSLSDNESAGVIVEDMQVPSWVAAICKLEDENIRKAMHEKMQFKLKQFDFDKMVNSYIYYATEYTR